MSSLSSASRPPFASIVVHSWTLCSAATQDSIVAVPYGSRFCLTEREEKKKGSWLRALTRERIVERGIRERSWESMKMVPERGSRRRRRVRIRVDLPLELC